MIVTTSWMASKFDEFNKKFWNSELKVPQFKTSRSSNMLGQALCKCTRSKLNATVSTSDYIIKMSIYYDQTEHYLEETLLHEMIHLYEYQKRAQMFYVRGYDWHGYFFQKEAKRLNDFGYNITKYVDEDKKAACNLTEHTKALHERKKANGYYIAIFNQKENSKNCHIFKLNEKLLEGDFASLTVAPWILSKYKSYEIYHTSSDELLNNRCSLKSYFIIDENVTNKIKKESKLIKKHTYKTKAA